MASNNIKTVKKFYEMLMSGDPSKLPTVMDQDIQLVMMKGWPYGGTYSGIDSAINDFFSKVRELLDPFTLEIYEYIDAGDVVISLGMYHTPSKETGQDMPSAFAHLWDVRDGKLTRMRQYADTVQISRALNHKVPEA
ncbi:MAG: nuclear transport factor 2 family protein [Candidatus Dadabacteria bacterium]|nr:nuclear transport factor 2 family protein [Candidatus Dadabacteria bacterium]